MFKGVTIDAKKKGLGVKNSYPPISDADLHKLGVYFNNDYMNFPNPKKLQHHMIFNIIYFFCRRGCENLYQMTKNTYKVHVDPTGLEYVKQVIDELDKNHSPDDTIPSNDGHMYADPGKTHTYHQFSSPINIVYSW